MPKQALAAAKNVSRLLEEGVLRSELVAEETYDGVDVDIDELLAQGRAVRVARHRADVRGVAVAQPARRLALELGAVPPELLAVEGGLERLLEPQVEGDVLGLEADLRAVHLLLHHRRRRPAALDHRAARSDE